MKTSLETETALPVRRGRAGGASERAVRQLCQVKAETLKAETLKEDGEALAVALGRRVWRLSEEIEAHWPRGSGARDMTAYHRTVRRWLRLRRELEQVLIAGGGL